MRSWPPVRPAQGAEAGSGVVDPANEPRPRRHLLHHRPRRLQRQRPSLTATRHVGVEAGTYRIAKSAWSVADFTVTFPDGWSVQYGHVFHTVPDTLGELEFYAVVVDAIYADACEGSNGELMEVGPSVR